MVESILQVDKNLQAIKAIEGAWSLPPVPDEVKLDLAGNTMMSPGSLGSLFNGLSDDLDKAGRRQPLPTRQEAGIPAPPVDRKTQVGLQIAGLTGLDAPQQFDQRAPQRLKQRLADGGYLDLSQEDIESEAWLPEYSFAARELNYDNLTKQFQGEKPGSVSLDQVFGFVDEWLSPRGLYRAAVELDLWWDQENIEREFKEWGSKVDAWQEDKLDPRKMIDMLTGPLDDILFPALNIALIWTGFTEVVAVARGLNVGLKGAQALAGTYRGSKGINFARVAAEGVDKVGDVKAARDIAQFAKPSFLSNKLGNPAIMDAWRRNSAVILGKKVNQQALRAGFSSNLQQAIDSDRGGQSLDAFTEGKAGEAIYETFSNPMFDWGSDLLFMPTNIWNPGTFAKPASKALEITQRGFRKAAENQDLLIAWQKPVSQFLLEMDPTTKASKALLDNLGAETPKKAAKIFEKRAARDMGGALADTFFDGSKDSMGEALGYVAVMAGLDVRARGLAEVAAGNALQELTPGVRGMFHQSRNSLTAQLKLIDPYDVNAMLDQLAKYGDEATEVVGGSRKASVFYRNRQRVEEPYLETMESMSARAGETPAGHTRYVGHQDVDTGLIDDWRPLKAGDDVADDPFFIDVEDGELKLFMRDAGAPDIVPDELPEQFWRRYQKYDDSGALRHNRLSEAENVRVYDPEKLAELRAIGGHHNELRATNLKSIMDDLTPKAMEQYVYEVLPTFGRWNQFNEGSAKVAQAALRGELDNVRFVSPMSESNRRLGAMPWTPTGEKWTDEMFQLVMALPNDKKLTASLMESVFSPFARNVDPQTGSFTLAAAGTVTKQEAIAFEASARRVLKMVKSVREIKAIPNSEGLLKLTAAHAAAVEGPVLTPGLREALAEAFGAVSGTDTAEDLARLARFADEAGVTIVDVERVLIDKLAEIDAMPAWAERFSVPHGVTQSGDAVEAVTGKVRELRKQSYFMASAVEDAPQYLTEDLAANGYQLVYGVEFAQPFDLDGIMPQFADASKRHMRLKSLGDFFSRQDPKAVSALKTRKVREALHAGLSTADAEGGRVLTFGDAPSPDNADQNMVLNDLWDLLHEVQEKGANRLDNLEGKHFLERVSSRASVARIPFDMTRLASDMTFKSFVSEIMGKGYSRAQARAMYKALQKSQALGFRTHGLYAIESKLRSEPNLLNGLRLLGSTQAGDGIRKGRAIAGTVGGGYAANRSIAPGEEDTFGRIGITTAGMLAGGIAGGSRLGLPGVRKGVDFLETTRALKWAYLADYTANVRDLVRFTLSPIFDASRYSEAIILNQLGELPEGLSNLRVNQSPTGLKKLLAKEHRARGLDPDAARRAATKEWKGYEAEFAGAAMGYRDFDWEVIDGVGRRFSSVGILGFSPVDWMASTFGHLRRGGVSQADAYQVVRDIYTYGTTGRSAAELSMNFVFFPFSFTKKTVGHFAKFFSDDIGRLVVTHDMLATYQLLNEKFNLSQEWKDRLPVLDKMHRMNLLAYGIGLGRFGGVNAPIIEGVASGVSRIPGFDALEDIPGAEAITNLFIPQMIPMNQVDDGNNASQILRQMLPVINDVNTMKDILIDQGHVIASEQHLTSQAEQRHAWDEWRTFQEEMGEVLDPAGVTWAQAVRRPEINAMIQRERTKISLKYPAWKQGIGDGIAHSVAIDMEMKERIQEPKTEGDIDLGRFEEMVNAMEDAMEATFSNSPESVPPEAFKVLRDLAISISKRNPEFLRIYNRFYRRNLGDITSDVTA